MMSIKNIKLLILLILLPVHSFADGLLVKNTAPEFYTVKKGDTLWDVSNVYLDKPWLWPQLWRTNLHTVKPHLIYPGDKLHLVRITKGETLLELVEELIKPEIKLYPKGIKLLKAIPALPWSVIKPYIDNELIMSQQMYDHHPSVLGNQDGTVRYATGNLVIGEAPLHSNENFNIVRKQKELYDMDGNFMGLQIRHIAKAKLISVPAGKYNIMTILQAKLEVERGDKIIAAVKNEPEEILLSAAQGQTGYIIDDLEQHDLLGNYNVVVLDLGASKVSSGTIMGIYNQGPKIIDAKQPRYAGETDILYRAFNKSDEITQPALKVGEVVVFKTFDTVSYALITKSANVIKRGMIVAKP